MMKGIHLLPMLLHADRRLLNRSVTLREVKKALFDVGPNKTPGPDGFFLAFFQHDWDILQTLIWEFVRAAFDNSFPVGS